MTLETYKRIVDSATILSGVAAILCLYKFSKRNLEVKFQVFGFLAVVIPMIYVEIYFPSAQVRNIIITAIVPAMDVPPLLMFDAAWNGRYRRVTILSITVLAAFGIWNFFFGQQLNFNSNTHVLASALVIVHCVLFYYYLLTAQPVQRLDRLPMFWFTAGYLTYCGGGLFIFAAFIVDAFRDSLLLYWGIQNGLKSFSLLLIIVGLCLDIRNLRLKTSSPTVQ